MAIGAVVVFGIFRVEASNHLVDAHTVRAWVERIEELNVSSYTGGANQRGPLWTALFLAAFHVADGPGFWFALAALEVLVVAGIALAIGGTICYATGSSHGALAAGGASFAYLVLGPEEYSFTLFSRNISGMLTAVSFALLWPGLAAWPHARGRIILAISGLAMGFATQTMPSSAPTVLVFGLVVLAGTLFRQRGWAAMARTGIAWTLGVLLGFASTPGYYLLRGDFENFWNLFWGYNQIYTEATTTPFATQLRHAVDVFTDYYSQHPVFLASVVIFAMLTTANLSRGEWRRGLFGIALLLWWVAEMFSITLGQRFFPHHFVLTFVPVAFMGALTLATVLRGVDHRLREASAALAVVIVACGSGLPGLQVGVDRAFDFRGLSRHAERQFLALPPERRAQRALVETVSTSRDHLMAWAHWTGFYDELDRPPATRYNAVSWFIGHVYGGGADARYILPGTFERWREDLRVTPARLFLVSAGPPWFPLAPPEPEGEIKQYLERNHTLLFEHFSGKLYIDRVLSENLQKLMSGPSGRRADLVDMGADGGGRLVPPPRGSCYLVRARMRLPAIPNSAISISLRPTDGDDPVVTVRVGDRVESIRTVHGREQVEADAPLPARPDDLSRMDLLVTGRSAAVFLNGQVVGMMRTTVREAELRFSNTEDAGIEAVTVRALNRSQWAPCGNGS